MLSWLQIKFIFADIQKKKKLKKKKKGKAFRLKKKKKKKKKKKINHIYDEISLLLYT